MNFNHFGKELSNVRLTLCDKFYIDKFIVVRDVYYIVK